MVRPMKSASSSPSAAAATTAAANAAGGVVKRKAVTKKSRAVSAVPGADDGAILVFCAYGCGISYTTYPRNVNRPHWHKTLRKLNAHESQRCPRNEDRKRCCRKNDKIRASSTANAPNALSPAGAAGLAASPSPARGSRGRNNTKRAKRQPSASSASLASSAATASTSVSHNLGPGAPSVVPDGGAAQAAATRRASLRRQSQLLAATVAAAVSAAAAPGAATAAVASAVAAAGGKGSSRHPGYQWQWQPQPPPPLPLQQQHFQQQQQQHVPPQQQYQQHQRQQVPQQQQQEEEQRQRHPHPQNQQHPHSAPPAPMSFESLLAASSSSSSSSYGKQAGVGALGGAPPAPLAAAGGGGAVRNDSISSLLSSEHLADLEELMNTLLEAEEPRTDLEQEDQELHERLTRELTPGVSPAAPATGVYWTEPLGPSPADKARTSTAVRQAVAAEQKQRQTPEESWRCGAALSFTRRVYPEFRSRLSTVRARSPLARERRPSGGFSLLSVDTAGARHLQQWPGWQQQQQQQQHNNTGAAPAAGAGAGAGVGAGGGGAAAGGGIAPPAAGDEGFGTIDPPAVLTTMHLNWGIGQEVPVRHGGRWYRGNIVAIGGYRGAAVLVQFFGVDGEMKQQLHRSTAPYPGGFSEASWIADVKAPEDAAAVAAAARAEAEAAAAASASASASSAAAAATSGAASLGGGAPFTQKQRRASGPNQRIVSVYARASPRTSKRGAERVPAAATTTSTAKPSTGSSGGSEAAAASAAAGLEAFPELDMDNMDTDLLPNEEIDEEPGHGTLTAAHSLHDDDDDDDDDDGNGHGVGAGGHAAGGVVKDEFSGLDGDDVPELFDLAGWLGTGPDAARRSSSFSALFGGVLDAVLPQFASGAAPSAAAAGGAPATATAPAAAGAGAGASAATDSLSAFEVTPAAQQVFAASPSTAAAVAGVVPGGVAVKLEPQPLKKQQPAVAAGAGPRIVKKRSRRETVFAPSSSSSSSAAAAASTASPNVTSALSMASTVQLVGNLKRALSQARRLSGMKAARKHSLGVDPALAATAGAISSSDGGVGGSGGGAGCAAGAGAGAAGAGAGAAGRAQKSGAQVGGDELLAGLDLAALELEESSRGAAVGHHQPPHHHSSSSSATAMVLPAVPR